MTMVKDLDVRGLQHCETRALGVLLRHEGLDLSEPMAAALVATAGESGDAKYLDQAGSILHELSRIERDAMQALSRL